MLKLLKMVKRAKMTVSRVVEFGSYFAAGFSVICVLLLFTISAVFDILDCFAYSDCFS
jgi:hypothetical protein